MSSLRLGVNIDHVATLALAMFDELARDVAAGALRDHAGIQKRRARSGYGSRRL